MVQTSDVCCKTEFIFIFFNPTQSECRVRTMLTLNCADLLIKNHNKDFFHRLLSRAMQYYDMICKPSSLHPHPPNTEKCLQSCGWELHWENMCFWYVDYTSTSASQMSLTHTYEQTRTLTACNPSTYHSCPHHSLFGIYLPVMFSCLGQIPREDVDKQSSSSGVTWTPTSTGLDALLSSPCEGEGGLSTVLSMHMVPLHCFLLCSIKMRISPKGKFIWHWPQVSRSWSPSGETCTNPCCSCLSSETTDDRGSAARGRQRHSRHNK